MLHIIDLQATLTDGTAAALAVVGDGSLTVKDGMGVPLLVAAYAKGNDVVYAKVHNNSKDWPQKDITLPVHDSLDTDGEAYVELSRIPVEPQSVFSVTAKSVAG